MCAIAGTYPPSLRAGIHPAEFSHGLNDLCMRLISTSSLTPTPRLRDVANDGLSALIDVDVLDPDRLLTAAPQLGECFGLRREGAQELDRHVAGALELRGKLGPVRAAHQLHGERV